MNHGEGFLSRPEWIETPWKLLSKTPLDELIDVLFGYHAVLQQFETQCHKLQSTMLQPALSETITKCLAINTALRALYSSFEKSTGGPLYWPELSTIESRLDDASSGKVFPISFHFPAFLVAQLVTTYWAGVMAVQHLLMSTYDKLAQVESLPEAASNSFSNGMPPLPISTGDGYALRSSLQHRIEWTNMVKNICQSAEYFLQDQMGVSGPLAIISHLLGCRRNLKEVSEEGWSREVGWMTEVIERMQKMVGFPVDTLFGK